MSKLRWVFGLGVVISLLHSAIEFEHQHRFALKKDELGYIFLNRKEVKNKASNENPDNEYMLKLRWTLYANEQLFVLVNYRGYPYQFVLKKNYPLEAVRLPLLSDGLNKMNAKTWVKIFFNDFDQSNKEAILDIFIEDNEERIQVEFVQPKKQ